ncbi:MAG: UDP-N-acetylmuramoyl-tripeptide--D-alanyl-D-alanine ligase [Micrococcales bacterium]
MIRLYLNEIASIVDGTLFGEDAEVFGGVETDSRLVSAGSLFVAKPGEVTDGHNFIGSAAALGAAGVIVERRITSESIPQILVQDSVKALGLLAKEVLARVRAAGNLQVVGITGSNGKTSTKNMLRAILSEFGETIAPIESYNNEVGAPISVLKVSETTRYLVAELGAGGLGSIAYLADIIKPDIGVVLKVGLAHAGAFGGIEVTAKIKSELVQALKPENTFVYNADDGEVRAMLNLTEAQPVSFGTNPDSDFYFSNVDLSIAGTSADIHYPDGEVSRITLKILGEHQLMNSTAAIAVSEQLGLPRSKVRLALEKMELAERWRMQLTNRADGISIINDAYNASPDSMKAALQTLAHLGKSGRRTIAVLGEMAELGEFSRDAHDEIGRLVVRYNIDRLIVVGEGAKLIHMGAMFEGSWDGESIFFDSSSEALTHIREMLVPGDIVLVKSSKSANLRHLGDDLLEVQS